jgi:hypothetical protein
MYNKRYNRKNRIVFLKGGNMKQTRFLIIAAALIFSVIFSTQLSAKVVSVKVWVTPTHFKGECPKKFEFKGSITADAPGEVQYKWIRSDGANAPVQTLNFARPGTQDVTSSWILGGAGSNYNEWKAIEIVYPNTMVSQRAGFALICVGHEPPPPRPRVIRVTAHVIPAAFVGPCPKRFEFTGKITTNGPVEVKYQWIRSDNAVAPVQTIVFDSAGTQTVNTYWELGGQGRTYKEWEALKILSPLPMTSNKAIFKLKCR